jgi:hypothetical protein
MYRASKWRVDSLAIVVANRKNGPAEITLIKCRVWAKKYESELNNEKSVDIH